MTDPVAEPARSGLHARLPGLLGWGLALCFLLLALVLSGARVWLAHLDEREAWLAAQLSERLGLDVRVEGLRGRMQGWFPGLVLERLQLAPLGAEPAIELRGVTLELDPLRSLLRWRPTVGNLVLESGTFELTLAEGGRLGLVGGGEAGGLPLATLADALLDAGYARVDELELVLVPLDGDVAAPDRLWVSGTLARTRLASRADLQFRHEGPHQSPAQGRLQMSLQAPPWRASGWRGEVALQGEALTLGWAARRLLPQGFDGGGRLEKLSLHAQRHHGLALQFSTSLSSFRFQDLEPLRDLHLSAEALTTGEGQGAMAVAELSARAGNRQLKLEGGHLAWRASEAETWYLQLPPIELETLRAIAGELPVMPAEAASWLQGMGPAGRLTDARARLDRNLDQFAMGGQLEGFSLTPFRKLPGVAGVNARVVAFESGAWLDVDSGPVSFQLPDVFPSAWNYRHAQGRVQMRWDHGRPRASADDLRVVADHASGRLGFLFDLRAPEAARQLTLMIGLEQGQVSAGRDYLPRRMPSRLRAWLGEALADGQVTAGGILLHAELAPDKRSTRVPELFFNVREGAIRFAPDWPMLRALDGSLQLVAGDFSARLQRGRWGPLQGGATRVVVPRGSGRVELSGEVEGQATDMATFLGALPWQASETLPIPMQVNDGMVEADFDLSLAPGKKPLLQHLQVTAELQDLALDLPTLDLSLPRVSGPVQYQHPGKVQAQALQADLLQGPVTIDVLETVPGDLHLQLAGDADAAAVADWLAAGVGVEAAVKLPYRVDLQHSGVGGFELQLSAQTDELVLDLPHPLRRPGSELQLKLGGGSDSPSELELQWGGLSARAQWREDQAWRGAMALGEALPALPDEGWILAAEAPTVDLARWWRALSERSASAGGRQAPVALTGTLELPQARWGERRLGDATITLEPLSQGQRLAFASDPLSLSLEQVPEQAPQLHLEHVRWPLETIGETAPASLTTLDPALPEALGTLGPVAVRIDELWWQQELIGNVGFTLSADGGALTLDEIEGTLRGLQLQAQSEARPARLRWHGGDGTAVDVHGQLAGEDAGSILERWGLAPTLEAERFAVDVDLAWSGTPLAPELDSLSGMLNLDIERGRFVQLESAAAPLRVVGLFNFASIARRMRLDFTDLYRRGMAFEEIDGQLQLGNGVLRSASPVRIQGPGSSFRLSGKLDLVARTLDGDIIVTLPVSDNLPWFAAYAVVLANPVAGAGVFVAERMFRDQIERFSSARYRLRGTLDDPEVMFVDIFPEAQEAIDTLPETFPQGSTPDWNWLLEVRGPLDWIQPFPLLLPLEEDHRD